MSVSINSTGDGLDQLQEGLAFLKSTRVMIGIPGGSGGHGDLTNAELAFLHTNGSPRLRIPPRPFLEPAIEGVKDKIAGRMKAAIEAAFDGDTGAATGEMHKAGLYGENAAKDYFTGGHFAPNAPITVEGGWMRNRISGKPFKVKGKGSSAPLIDTGSLRSSITHVIEQS